MGLQIMPEQVCAGVISGNQDVRVRGGEQCGIRLLVSHVPLPPGHTSNQRSLSYGKIVSLMIGNTFQGLRS